MNIYHIMFENSYDPQIVYFLQVVQGSGKFFIALQIAKILSNPIQYQFLGDSILLIDGWASSKGVLNELNQTCIHQIPVFSFIDNLNKNFTQKNSKAYANSRPRICSKRQYSNLVGDRFLKSYKIFCLKPSYNKDIKLKI